MSADDPKFCGCEALPSHGRHGRELCPICSHVWNAHDQHAGCMESESGTEPTGELVVAEPNIPREWWLRAKAMELALATISDGGYMSAVDTETYLQAYMNWIEKGELPS